MDTSGKAFLEFLDWAADKGEINPNTAIALKVTANKVLEVNDDWETLDISTLNIDDAFRRFTNLRSKDYKATSLRVYKQRFRQAVEMFLSYTRDPSNWKPAVRNEQNGKKSPPRQQTQTSKRQPTKETPQDEASPHNLVRYPFPLREGLVVYLDLPTDLRSQEIKRLSAFMTTLVVDTEN